jgi:spermidine synthase
VQVDEQRLGLDPGDGVTVRVEDGRRGLARLAADSRDLVVGDAFGGVSVPWHLTTREAIGEIERVLTGDGVYAMNLIDQGELGFARAALATLQDTFDHVALTAPPWTLDKVSGGNMVAVASDDPLDLEALGRELGRQGTDWSAISGAELDRWVDGAEVLTDDHAPVDQLLTTSF